MDRDEEKDLFIKAKLKDDHIPEKIDDLFNNSINLVENKEKTKKNKNQLIFKRVAGIAACAVLLLGGGNIYATTQGYDNVFFMIKEWVVPSDNVHGKDEILSDRDITISYKSIEIAKGIKMQINRLLVKDDITTLYLKIDQSETELEITPFTYVVRDEKGKEICNYTSENEEMIYTEELELEGLKKNVKKLELEIKQNDETTLVKFDIDLENKEIQVIGNEQELQKISEIELKKYLSEFVLQNYENDETEKDIEGLCIDVTDIMYSNGIYTVTFTYCYPTQDDIKENRIEDLSVYEMTIGLTINEDEYYSKYRVSSKMESKLIKPGKEEIENREDEDLKKFIGKWELDYIMQSGEKYGYEFSISSVRNTDKKVTLEIKEDLTFDEFIEDDIVYTGEYIKIDENTIKRTYDDGFVVYTTCQENELGETVISNICRMDQQKYEYYVKEINQIKENLVGNWWRSYNVDHEEHYKLNLNIKSDGTFVESELQEPDEKGTSSLKTTGIGTYKITQNAQWDVIVLTYDNGETHELLYGQKGTSKDNQNSLHYSAGRQVFKKFITVN